MKTWTKNQTISHAVLLTLLVLELVQSLLVLIHDDLINPSLNEELTGQLRFWVIILYGLIFFGGFPLIALVIGLNQDHLQKLNMDRFYIVLLIASGLIVLYSLPYNFFAIIALIYAVYILFDGNVSFGTLDDKALRMILLIVGVFAGIMICITGFGNAVKIDLPNAEESLRHFLLQTIPISIHEEAVYRGMLYMFLKDMGVSETKAFYTQAFLFWIKHINSLLESPIFFWIILPVLSLTYGYVAARTKSLTPSTIAHILYNAFATFQRLVR